jgi:hypothetical protein
MRGALEYKKKIVVESSRSALKRKNISEEGGASRSRVKNEKESTLAKV